MQDVALSGGRPKLGGRLNVKLAPKDIGAGTAPPPPAAKPPAAPPPAGGGLLGDGPVRQKTAPSWEQPVQEAPAPGPATPTGAVVAPDGDKMGNGAYYSQLAQGLINKDGTPVAPVTPQKQSDPGHGGLKADSGYSYQTSSNPKAQALNAAVEAGKAKQEHDKELQVSYAGTQAKIDASKAAMDANVARGKAAIVDSSAADQIVASGGKIYRNKEGQLVDPVKLGITTDDPRGLELLGLTPYMSTSQQQQDSGAETLAGMDPNAENSGFQQGMATIGKGVGAVEKGIGAWEDRINNPYASREANFGNVSADSVSAKEFDNSDLKAAANKNVLGFMKQDYGNTSKFYNDMMSGGGDLFKMKRLQIMDDADRTGSDSMNALGADLAASGLTGSGVGMGQLMEQNASNLRGRNEALLSAAEADRTAQLAAGTGMNNIMGTRATAENNQADRGVTALTNYGDQRLKSNQMALDASTTNANNNLTADTANQTARQAEFSNSMLDRQYGHTSGKEDINAMTNAGVALGGLGGGQAAIATGKVDAAAKMLGGALDVSQAKQDANNQQYNQGQGSTKLAHDMQMDQKDFDLAVKTLNSNNQNLANELKQRKTEAELRGEQFDLSIMMQMLTSEGDHSDPAFKNFLESVR